MSERLSLPVYPAWRTRAACVDADPEEFFPLTESDRALTEVREAWCDWCPVRSECLTRALVRNEDGFWGGTSTAERKRLRRTRSRLKCPACKAPFLVQLDAQQICLGCGVSWKAAPEADSVPQAV